MKNRYPGLTKRLISCHPSELAVSAVTVYELFYGAGKSRWGERTRQKLAMFLAPFTILPFEAGDAIAAGQIRAYLKQKGMPIGPYDLQIAGQGIARRLTVLTNNTEEFSRVPGLKIEDWVE
ncbi:MAG: type II toxin-antitoxin system VapC family toxin [Lachnospiraceae bacterium]|nr:type II toxin-antitoxin system VapC family toxin [Lachnospiraceae bacterium]